MMVDPRMFGASVELTPEEEEHERKLAAREWDIEIYLLEPDGTIRQVRTDTARTLPHGVVVPDTSDGRPEHDREEEGTAVTYPWHRILSIHSRWWVPDDAKLPPAPVRTGQYL